MVDLHGEPPGIPGGRGGVWLPFHRVDARVKLVGLIGYIVLATGLKAWPNLLAGIAFLGLLLTLTGTGWRRAAARLALASPLAGAMLLFLPLVTPGHPWQHIEVGPWDLVLNREGFQLAAVLGLRMANALLAAALLLDTSPWGDLMAALRSLGVPAAFVQLIDVTLRYIFVTAGELARMKTALKARCFKSGRSLLHRDTFSTWGQVTGTLFIRSWERSERVYQAMLARGMAGGPAAYAPVTPPRGGDLAWGLVLVGTGLILRLLEPGGWAWAILSR
ncbi:MAG: Cobalt ABC transporter, inner membrane subunit CbiQ [Moorella sp. 60_41]|nr:MAG: Cobalt ABC transporter, inner membrane subunit CbiQ [Moorella sp. 60_41]